MTECGQPYQLQIRNDQFRHFFIRILVMSGKYFSSFHLSISIKGVESEEN